MNRIHQLLFCFGLLLICSVPLIAQPEDSIFQLLHGAIVRGDSSKAEIALVFTGDSYAEGGIHIASVLAIQDVRASFFFTGRLYRNPELKPLIQTLLEDGHYLGAHSDQHLLYCDWIKRDCLLVQKEQFTTDLLKNYRAMLIYNIHKEDAPLFLPPYEWYNDSVAQWTSNLGLELINHSYGTLSHADYTVPGTSGYKSSEEIFQSILDYEESSASGLNGFILLAHIGTAPERTDKFYFYLEQLLEELTSRGYRFIRIDELLNNPCLLK